MPEFDFHKSSHSDAEHECVEVATNVPGVVAVRDSKRADGSRLRVAPHAWCHFLDTVTQPAPTTS